jgi:hypothetical protein
MPLSFGRLFRRLVILTRNGVCAFEYSTLLGTLPTRNNIFRNITWLSKKKNAGNIRDWRLISQACNQEKKHLGLYLEEETSITKYFVAL